MLGFVVILAIFPRPWVSNSTPVRCRLAWLHNRVSSKTISIRDSIVIWWAGMMRGAVSVAMVYYRFDPNNEADDKHAATIVVTTLQLVLYSTVGLGGLTGPFLCRLLPPQEVRSYPWCKNTPCGNPNLLFKGERCPLRVEWGVSSIG